MKLTVLGRYGPYPAPGGATSGYLLTAGETRVLLECGSGVLSRLFAYTSVDRLSAVLLSHLHDDHIADLAVLGYACQSLRQRGVLPEGFRLKIYLPRTPEFLFERVSACASGDVFSLVPVGAGDSVRIGTLKIVFCPARHPVQSVGMRIGDGASSLYYTGDTNALDTLARDAAGADALLADCGLPNALWSESSPHLSAGLCGILAREAGAKRLLLGHLPPYADADALRDEAAASFPTVELLREGEICEIG